MCLYLLRILEEFEPVLCNPSSYSTYASLDIELVKGQIYGTRGFLLLQIGLGQQALHWAKTAMEIISNKTPNFDLFLLLPMSLCLALQVSLYSRLKQLIHIFQVFKASPSPDFFEIYKKCLQFLKPYSKAFSVISIMKKEVKVSFVPTYSNDSVSLPSPSLSLFESAEPIQSSPLSNSSFFFFFLFNI